MINNSDFAKRLTTIMDYFQMSASVFADRIQVPRSSISHLLSGRNKPSLDFVMKVIKEFDEVELYWLLNGKGEFPKSNISSTATNDHKEKSQATSPPQRSTMVQEKSFKPVKKNIDRIVVFYEDGTFKEYTQ